METDMPKQWTQTEVEQLIWRQLRRDKISTLDGQLAWLRANRIENAPALYHAAHAAVCEEIEEHLVAWSAVQPQIVRVVWPAEPTGEYIGMTMIRENQNA